MQSTKDIFSSKHPQDNVNKSKTNKKKTNSKLQKFKNNFVAFPLIFLAMNLNKDNNVNGVTHEKLLLMMSIT